MKSQSGKTAGRAAALLAATVVVASAQARAEDARVLPQGRSRFTFAYGQSGQVTETFDGSGKAQSITAPYNVDLDSSNLRKFSPDFDKLVNWLNSTGMYYNPAKRNNEDHGVSKDPTDGMPLGDALSRGSLGVSAAAERQQYNVAYMFGITDHFSAGIILPYMKNTVNVNAAFNGVNTADDIYAMVAADNPNILPDIRNGLNQLRSVDNSTLQSLLASKGYDAFSNFQMSGFGDIALGSRYNYLNAHPRSGEWIASFQGGLILPTGRLSPPAEITGVDFGDGAYQINAAHILNYTPFRLLTLSHAFHYTYRFADHRLKRIRANDSDLIPGPEDEEMATQKLGDKVWTNVAARLNFTKAINLEANYEWYYKYQDSYSGHFTDRDYGYLSAGTDSYTETLSVSASISSIPAFLKYDFPLPMDFSVSFNYPTRGRNAYIAPFGTAELDFYF